VTSINLLIHAEFASAWSRFKLIINSCYSGLVRTIYCLLENINNFNKKNPWSNIQKFI